jgi:dGTPase
MEAADDICYLCADIEDAYNMKLLTFEESKTLLEDIAYGYKKHRFDRMKEEAKISYLTAAAIGNLTQEAGDVFLNNFESITMGQRENDLLYSINNVKNTKNIREKLNSIVINSPHMAKIEVMSCEVITFFLDRFVPSVIDQKKDDHDPFCKRFLSIITEMPSDKDTLYNRLLCVTDFMSGMTDSYALKLYRELKGISRPIFTSY